MRRVVVALALASLVAGLLASGLLTGEAGEPAPEWGNPAPPAGTRAAPARPPLPPPPSAVAAIGSKAEPRVAQGSGASGEAALGSAAPAPPAHAGWIVGRVVIPTGVAPAQIRVRARDRSALRGETSVDGMGNFRLPCACPTLHYTDGTSGPVPSRVHVEATAGWRWGSDPVRATLLPGEETQLEGPLTLREDGRHVVDVEVGRPVEGATICVSTWRGEHEVTTEVLEEGLRWRLHDVPAGAHVELSGYAQDYTQRVFDHGVLEPAEQQHVRLGLDPLEWARFELEVREEGGATLPARVFATTRFVTGFVAPVTRPEGLAAPEGKLSVMLPPGKWELLALPDDPDVGLVRVDVESRPGPATGCTLNVRRLPPVRVQLPEGAFLSSPPLQAWLRAREGASLTREGQDTLVVHGLAQAATLFLVRTRGNDVTEVSACALNPERPRAALPPLGRPCTVHAPRRGRDVYLRAASSSRLQIQGGPLGELPERPQRALNPVEPQAAFRAGWRNAEHERSWTGLLPIGYELLVGSSRRVLDLAPGQTLDLR